MQGRWRLDRAPALAWAAGALAVLAALLAFAASPLAALLMVFAALACFWAAREARRYVIAPREEQIELVGLAELAPLLEALPDPALSGQHFRIVPDEGRFYLLDLRSTNGTFVNGERAVVRELASGDVIHAGQIECSFRSFAQPMG